jgi:DNA-binding GntR family transcriptional regulator
VLEAASNLRAGAHIIYHTFRWEEKQPLHRTRKEHHQILGALLSGDENEARQIMAEHIRYGCQLALDANSTRHMQDRDAGRLHVHAP